MEPCVFYAPLDRYVGQHIDWHIGRLIIWYVGQYVNRYIGQYIGWDVSVDISTNVWIRYWSSYGWHIDRLSADSSVNRADDIRPICWLLIIGGISVDCPWSISRLSYNISQKFRVSVSDVWVTGIRISSFFGQTQKFLKGSCLDHVGKFRCYQARHLSEILPNTENTKKKGRKKGKVRG